jgi:hypothetical protein
MVPILQFTEVIYRQNFHKYFLPGQIKDIYAAVLYKYPEIPLLNNYFHTIIASIRNF